MKTSSHVTVSLPLHFQANENEGVYAGLTIDASESGLRIQTLEEMPVGTRIDIEVMFPKKLNLANFKAEAEVVWKDTCRLGDWRGYQYELKFIRVSKEDHLKLKQTLSNTSCLKEIREKDSKGTEYLKQYQHGLRSIQILDEDLENSTGFLASDLD